MKLRESLKVKITERRSQSLLKRTQLYKLDNEEEIDEEDEEPEEEDEFTEESDEDGEEEVFVHMEINT